MEYLVKVQDYLKLKIKDTYRVTNVGKEIAKKEGLNVEDLMIACLLHDVSDFECLKDQLKISTAYRAVDKCFYTIHDLFQILNICLNISCF